MIETVQIRITGKVQGVFFRKYTLEQALLQGVTGTVSNRPDGSVFITATGNEAQLEAFSNWCRTGPPRAVVNGIIIEKVAFQSFTRFSILR